MGESENESRVKKVGLMMSGWAELGKCVERLVSTFLFSVHTFAHTHTVPVRECMLVLYNDKVTAFICSTGGNVTQYT